MPTLRGWLFFARKNCRIIFVPEDNRDVLPEDLDWTPLENLEHWQKFLNHFSLEGVQTERGFQVYLRIDVEPLRAFLADLKK